MKRNRTSSRAMRHRKIGGKPADGKSKYGLKRRSGKQMYSAPGYSCCAHRVMLPGHPRREVA